MKPSYFDPTVTDLGHACEFLARVPGWKFRKFDMPFEYYRIRTGADGEPGIDGGTGETKAAPLGGGKPMAVITVSVADLDEVLSRVSAIGGRVAEGRMGIPGIGWYASCAEPGGLVFGLMQAELAQTEPAARGAPKHA